MLVYSLLESVRSDCCGHKVQDISLHQKKGLMHDSCVIMPALSALHVSGHTFVVSG